MVSLRLLRCAVILAAGAGALVQGPWSNVDLSPDERAQLLLSKLTLDEKLNFLHGTGPVENNEPEGAYTGNVLPIERLGIPPIHMNDGPQGFRPGGIAPKGTSTAFPSGLTIAASWDIDAAYEWGAGMGKEFYNKGANVQLGPAVCVARLPRNGRNFEYISGEEPILGKALVQPAVRGIQSQKVVANAKHWVLNNQETHRTTDSAEIDERTRFEVYYPPFEGAIDADVGSFMCGYNKINGVWSCENPVTLGELKNTLGFKGYVMSDWGATHSTSVMAGLDMEMPSKGLMNPELIKPGLAAGSITMAAVDDAVTRIFRAMFAVGVMDEPNAAWDYKKRLANTTTMESVASARRLSAASTVLLKNANDVLPLPKGKKLALIGFASTNAVVHGGGSGSVSPSHVATPLEAITAKLGSEVFFNDGTNITAAAELAAASDYAIVFVGTLSSEGGDRASLSLDDGCYVQDGQCEGNSKNQNQMVAAIAKANSKSIVVASVPGAVLLPWSSDVAAILTNFMPGQQAGTAIADVLFGDVNPSAKLPLTFPNIENETEVTPAQWPGIKLASFYTEKALIGYRYYDAHNISFTTGFPFGHGLSYTKFVYADLIVAGRVVSFSVKNAGKVAGNEVAQLYLGFPASAGEPPLLLKAFKKTKKLAAGETELVTLTLSPRDFSIWDAGSHRWSLVQGSFKIMVGSSSRDIRLDASLLQTIESTSTAVYV